MLFDGWEKSDALGGGHRFTRSDRHGVVYRTPISKLSQFTKYHTSYDWLMPVFIKNIIKLVKIKINEKL